MLLQDATFNKAKSTPEDYEQVPRIGWIVWHEVGPISQTWTEAEAILAKNGLDPAPFPRTTNKGAYLMAIDEVREGSRSTDLRILPRPIRETSEAIRHSIIIERVTADDALSHASELLISFNKLASEIEFTNGKPDSVDVNKIAIEEKIKVGYARYCERVYKWTLGKYVTLLLDRCHAVSVRSTGGVWFVPDAYTPTVKALEAAFTDFGAGCIFYRHPVIDTVEWRRNVATMADREMAVELRSMKDALEGIKAEAKQDGKVRSKTLDTQLSHYKRVIAKAEAYESLLSYRAGDVRQVISDLEKDIRDILSGKFEGIRITGKDKEEKPPKIAPKRGRTGKRKPKTEKAKAPEPVAIKKIARTKTRPVNGKSVTSERAIKKTADTVPF